jgi:uncharacterized protein with NAD-binding domain and iron-sulfur cluster
MSTETVPPPSLAKPKKLAILGSGVASIVTAFEITNDPDWKKKFERITVYQMGWRSGGKGASGRRAPYGSIEEHGLHIWLGFYNHAFAAMQRAYQELGRPAGAPLATWTDAFKKHSFIVLAQEFKGTWYPWTFHFWENGETPGKGNPMPTLFEYMKLTAAWLKDVVKKSPMSRQGDTKTNSRTHQQARDWLGALVETTFLDVELGAATLAEDMLNVLVAHLDKLETNTLIHAAADHAIAIDLLRELGAWLNREVGQQLDVDLTLTRFYILMDTGLTGLRGLFADGVLLHPDKLNSLDGEDLREWLLRHGAAQITACSPLMQGLYDLVFAYENGEVSKPNFAAGTAIRCVFRIVFSYKGAIFWKMQAGMGDTVFTPFYNVLKRRGVEFKFFHRVKELDLSADGKSISAISLGRQATVKGGQDYYPFVEVCGLECWPSEPNYDQLVEGDKLKESGANLESFYTTWEDVEDITLRVNDDFDEVVYGIAIGSIPYLCPKLVSANPAWQKMVAQVATVRTMAFQSWMNKSLADLGWRDQSPVMDAYVEPMNTWADMSQLIVRENWPASSNIRNIAYFCGPMEGEIAPPSKTDEPEIALATVQEVSNDFLNRHINQWWPGNVDHDGKFDWNTVAALFYRANIDPSERYVLSLKGSTPYRLRGDQSGFKNLVLAGDWTINGLNAGCVEAATMSGLIAANTLLGQDPLANIEGYGER